MLSKILQKILAWFARRVIKKYKPIVIGITGSVGKSSTKEAVYVVLQNYFSCRRSLKNYNNEIGVPLTVLGRRSPGRNFVGWLRVFWMSLGNVIFRNDSYPKILVLEMAADRAGDIEYLINTIPLNTGIITAISPAHTEFLGNLENIAKEKQALITKLPPNGWAILNADDERVMSMRDKTRAKIITFGLSEQADVRAIEVNLDQEAEEGGILIRGLKFKVNYAGSVIPMFLSGAVARSQVYVTLAAIAVGITFDLNLIEITETLKKYQSLPGRMVLIPGIESSLIIDDTYNSSPMAVQLALETLKEIKIRPQSKRWAVLGDMRELGYLSQQSHYDIGKKIGQLGFDYLVTVGQEAKEIARGARQFSMDKNKIFSFEKSEQVSEFLRGKIKKGDIILLKGSQAVRMEKIVEKIMAEPQKARKLLVRQDQGWL